MQCPYCKSTDSRVVDSRVASGGRVTWRRRECDDCQKRFTTYERVEHSLPHVIKRDGRREPFDRNKLLQSLRVACAKRPVSDEDLDTRVETLENDLAQEGLKEIPSRALGERVMQCLKDVDEVAYVRFASVYKSFRDIDEFIREMSKLVSGRTIE
jgi:transcriptional repressor NrdR